MKRFVQKFEMQEEMFLSEEVYPVKKKRDIAYLNALLRAATLGNFTEMEDFLYLMHKEGKCAEELLKGLEAHFLPSMETDRLRAAAAFENFERGKLGLLEAVRQLGAILLECNRYGYKPDAMTVEIHYKKLLTPTEKINYPLYLNQVPSSITNDKERMVKALEMMGVILEDAKPKQQNDGSGLDFAGYAGGGRRGNRGKGGQQGPRRWGLGQQAPKAPAQTQAPRQQPQGQQQKACRDCGFTTCKSLQPGQGKAACKAHETGQTCNYCGREGHFASTCRIKAKEAAKGGRAHAALAASVGF
jgi:hypothetical protein